MLDLILGKPKRKSSASSGGWSGVGGGARTKSGESVTQKSALMFDAVWCASRVLAETCSMVPLSLMRANADGGSEEATDDFRYDLTTLEPNPDMGVTAFRECMMLHQLNSGNAFAEIQRTMGGAPLFLWPLLPERVKPCKSRVTDASGREYGPGDYLVKGDGNTYTPLAKQDMLHIPGALSDDGIWGKGIIDYARESIGLGVATEKHGASFFGSGGQPLGIITDPSLKDIEARRHFRQEWREIHSPAAGGNAGEIAILAGKESKYEKISASNQEGQYIDVMREVVTKIARWYRVPPHILYDLMRATNNNIEHQGREFVLFSLRPWMAKWHDELAIKLLSREERETLYFAHDTDDLMSGDRKSRAEADAIELRCGKLSINEARQRDGRPGIGEAGDQYYVMTNMTTAEQIAENPPPGKQPTMPAADDEADGGKDANLIVAENMRQAFMETLRGRTADALHRLFVKEANAVERRLEAKETDLASWLDEFHGRHVSLLSEALATALRTAPQAGVQVHPTKAAERIVAASRKLLVAAFLDPHDRGEMKDMLASWAVARTNEELNRLFSEGAKHAA